MPLYMDLHILPGVKARDVAEAHRRDLLIQDDHRCSCMTYWIDEKRGNVFCLIDAPNREAVTEMHRKAHGLIPNKIIEVNSNLVELFLGRISDPDSTITTEDGLRVFNEASYRTILMISLQDKVLLAHQVGMDKANGLMRSQQYIIQKEISTYAGTEVVHGKSEVVASFVAPGNAIRCALSIRDMLKGMLPDEAGFKIALHAGDPIMQSETFFGDTVGFAKALSLTIQEYQVVLSATVRELAFHDHVQYDDNNIVKHTIADEEFLRQLFEILEKKWQDPDFNMETYGQQMATSASQLYRKTLSLTGHSPNNLLREYRLLQAKEMLKKSAAAISQVTYECGFSSPSYFTKVFKKRFGMVPNEYLEMASR